MFLHDIASAIVKDEIPNELILNVDLIPSKFVPMDNVTMTEKRSKHVFINGSNDKCGITVITFIGRNVKWTVITISTHLHW